MVYTYLVIPLTISVATMVFEEAMVTHEKWIKPFSWKMSLRLELSEPPCDLPLTVNVEKFEDFHFHERPEVQRTLDV